MVIVWVHPPHPVKVQFTSYKWSYGPLLITDRGPSWLIPWLNHLFRKRFTRCEFGLSTASRWSKFIIVHPESQINSKKYSRVTVVCIVGYRIYSWHSSDFYVLIFELWPTPQEFETNLADLACQKWDWAGNLNLFFTSHSLEMEQFEALQMYLKIPKHIQEIDLALGVALFTTF